MDRPGQLSHSLFGGIDETRQKTFTIEVNAQSTLSALNTLEKAVADLKMRILHFRYEGTGCNNEKGVNATFRYSDGGCRWCSGNMNQNR